MSKRLPEAARNVFYCRVGNVYFSYKYCYFAHILKRVDFDAIVDHLALMHIIQSKAEPTTTQVETLLEV